MQELMGISRFCKQICHKVIILFNDLNIEKIHLSVSPEGEGGVLPPDEGLYGTTFF